jgi:hypothetical protein
MLMVLPLLSPTSIDYSHLYGLREIFTFGRSSCSESTFNKEEGLLDIDITDTKRKL